jgi:hypothetical protein
MIAGYVQINIKDQKPTFLDFTFLTYGFIS